MTTRSVAISLMYAVGQSGLGLLLHPYQTMQSLVRDKVFVWMSLWPTLMLAFITLLWRFGVVPGVRLFFSCQVTPIMPCEVLPFISNWLTFFCIYWQILLLYLLFRFTWIFKTAPTRHT